MVEKNKKTKLDKKEGIKRSPLKIFFLIFVIIILIASLFFILKEKKPEENTNVENVGTQIQIVPLSNVQINVVAETVLSSEFIKDLPKNGIIALQFYDFIDGQRVWQSGFLIGKDGFLSEGTPDLVLIMHSKYISELDGTNLCDVIQSANANGDLGLETSESEARLLLKYSGIIKHRDCIGL